MYQLLFAVLFVLLASGICSGTEAALFSVRIVRVRQLLEEGHPAAGALLAIRENMSRPIATVVILNNIANIVGSITVGTLAAHVLGEQWLGVFSGILTFLVIIFAEIIPKTIGEQFAEPIALAAARPIQVLTYVFTPLVWLIEQITAPFTRGQRFPLTDESEIELLTKIGEEEGSIEEDESEMIRRVFLLNDLAARDLMTPRVAMTSLLAHMTLAEAQEAIIASPHSRIVVTGESVDDVLGMALKTDLLAALIRQEGQRTVAEFVRPVHFVPHSVRADALLDFFQSNRQHLAVVIDEFGGVAGVITLEDVLETLTGAIVDETDEFPDLRAAARQRTQASWRNQEGLLD
ncbi:hemolysin family protein [Litorilinea aerophila]|uniref:HlyC/CorC family transporter n=1 Tax=Litorilinea aerophila TaxID=1204385 RepID=A0A540VDI9_9CHLR|nr:hemolysin family protein [Litorilinea aerophila]MCC9077339.1 hemolysin family protein [Litorilinea aerophila]OUC06695.1 hypothetical protein RY27_19450 [Litorilinea aerophila]